MNTKKYFFIPLLSSILLTGCRNNDLTSENEALRQQITELEYHVTELEQEIVDMRQSVALQEENSLETVSPDTVTSANNGSVPQNDTNSSINSENSANKNPSETTYTLKELSSMVDEFVASVGSATPDVNNSGNLDQFFSLKREGDQLEHALENHENSLEDQYRAGTLSREDFRKLDKEIENLEETLDSAFDRLEIAFGIDD